MTMRQKSGSDPRDDVGSLGAFLESYNQAVGGGILTEPDAPQPDRPRSEAPQPDAEHGAGTLESAPPADRGHNAVVLLKLLAAGGPRTVSQLLISSGIGFEQFMDAFKAMLNDGQILLTGPPGAELVELTARGRDFASRLS